MSPPYSDFFFKITGDDKDCPIFNFSVDKIIDYSNDLETGKIEYLRKVLEKFVEHCKANSKLKFSDSQESSVMLKGIDESIKSSKFYKTINSRLQFHEKHGENVIWDHSYAKALERLKRMEGKRREAIMRSKLDKKKDLFSFDFEKIQNRCNKMRKLKNKIVYLQYVMKELTQNKELIETEKFEQLETKLKSELDFVNSKGMEFEMDYNKGDKVTGKKKVIQKSRKFMFQGTELSILILVDFLYQAGFLTKKDYDVRHAILRDSFLNKDGNPYDNKQLSVAYNELSDRKENEILNEAMEDISKFKKLYKLLEKKLKDSS